MYVVCAFNWFSKRKYICSINLSTPASVYYVALYGASLCPVLHECILGQFKVRTAPSWEVVVIYTPLSWKGWYVIKALHHNCLDICQYPALSWKFKTCKFTGFKSNQCSDYGHLLWHSAVWYMWTPHAYGLLCSHEGRHQHFKGAWCLFCPKHGGIMLL
jgi:hypothetical protein